MIVEFGLGFRFCHVLVRTVYLVQRPFAFFTSAHSMSSNHSSGSVMDSFYDVNIYIYIYLYVPAPHLPQLWHEKGTPCV